MGRFISARGNLAPFLNNVALTEARAIGLPELPRHTRQNGRRPRFSFNDRPDRAPRNGACRRTTRKIWIACDDSPVIKDSRTSGVGQSFHLQLVFLEYSENGNRYRQVV
jgi:hypothetical protein